MEKLQSYFSELASLFGYQYNDSWFDYLKSISTPNNQSCGKIITKGEGYWKCKNCQLNSNSIYCNDCFIKEKHKGHEIYFNPNGFGFCDCGDEIMFKREEGFCDKHKGDYDNIKDLMNYIKTSIDEKLLKNINETFDKIFLLFIEKMKNLYDYKIEVYNMLDNLEIFTDKLYKNNLSLFYLFTLKFTENYPYETKHKCFSYDENKKIITFIKRDKGNKHTCICPFMQIMVYLLIKRYDKQSSHNFYNLFFKTYKNKIITTLCYFNSFSLLFAKDNMKPFIEMDYQLINENFLKLIYQEQNITFLESFFEDAYSLFDSFMKKESYLNFNNVSFRFYLINIYLARKHSNIKIINIIIDIVYLINDSNIFKNNNVQEDFFSNSQFDYYLLYSQLYLLYAINIQANILNLENEELTKSIFNKILSKIYEFKKYKESLP